MREANQKTTTRRDLMGAAGFTAVAGIAAVSIAKPEGVLSTHTLSAQPGENSDAPLLAWCARFLKLQAAIDATYDREVQLYETLKQRGLPNKQLHDLEVQGEAERVPLCNEQVDLLDRIFDVPAATLAGQRARARVFIAWYCLRSGGEHSPSVDRHHLVPLLSDLLGEAV